ncbi:MAG TPA: response regulator, partial [Quisquiliibacterium sp.]|nr:response regulator [Quisquiliibacterium sp.]
DELLRVPGRVVDRMLDLAAEAAILLSQVQEQVALLNATRAAFRLGTERLGELSGELDRLVDGRGVSLTGRRSRGEFDALEFDDFDELHTVSRRIAESAADEKLIEQQLQRHGFGLAESVGHLERVQTDLREAVMQSRMMAVSSIAPRLQRAARQAARMIGRRIELAIVGEQTAVDAQLLQRIVDPIAHLLRNAVDHGIEPEERRIAQGKPATGRIELRFERDGALLRVHCTDDGAGLDLDAIRRKALALGLLAHDQAPTDAQIARLTLHPGFSTRDAATQVSGRGIGLDVVNRTVQGLRGAVDITSSPGAGTTVTLAFPERMATTAVAVSRTPSHVLALSVRGVERVLAADGLAPDERGALRFVLEDDVVPAVPLDVALGLPAGFFARDVELARRSGAAHATASAAQVVLLVRRDDGERVALVAPDLAQTRNVVVRPFPSWMPRRRAIDGAAVLGDGAVAPVIDLPALLAGGDPVVAPDVELPTAGRAAPVCLVVDDSVSVRRSMQTFLQDLGFEVDAAGDGVEALAMIERRVPDVAIVDLEMPRMNGVEFAAALRAHERTVEVPVIMITSRYSERHRAMAIDAGVDVFLTKPYSEDELAAHVRRCLERGAALG